MIYRRRRNRDAWHYCRSCRWWPTAAGTFVESDTKPSGEFCNECRSKFRRGDCGPDPVLAKAA